MPEPASVREREAVLIRKAPNGYIVWPAKEDWESGGWAPLAVFETGAKLIAWLKEEWMRGML